MAVTLAQTLGQNVGMMWNKHRTAAGTQQPPGSSMGTMGGGPPSATKGVQGSSIPQPLCSPLGDCRCPDSWLGCIMEDTGWVPLWGHWRRSCPALGTQPGAAPRWHWGVTVPPAPQVLPPAEVLPLQHR